MKTPLFVTAVLAALLSVTLTAAAGERPPWVNHDREPARSSKSDESLLELARAEDDAAHSLLVPMHLGAKIPDCTDALKPCPSVLERDQQKAESMLKAVLRDPDSYVKVGWLACAEDQGCMSYERKSATVTPDSHPWVLHYRARNGFGGYVFGARLFWFDNVRVNGLNGTGTVAFD